MEQRLRHLWLSLLWGGGYAAKPPMMPGRPSVARVLKLRNLLLPQFHTGAPALGPGVVQAWPFLPQVSRLPVVLF